MIDYKKAGVDIDKANLFIRDIIPIVKSTQGKGVLSEIGGFAGLYSIKEFKKLNHPVLVASTDGVGTKIKLCALTEKYWTAGYDLVAMNVNDIITTGAKPLFFLDYFAMSKLKPQIGKEIIKGIVKGCKDSGMGLLGGETAELPGFYKKGDFELAGFALGIVEKDRIITGERIRENDILIGLPSSGPHSNGYSLIRKIFSSREVKSKFQRQLLQPTSIYVREIANLIIRDIDIKGMAHITGGGFYDNIGRLLPPDLDAVIELGSWQIPFIFKEIQKRSQISIEKMYRTFNMGIGFVLIISRKELLKVDKILSLRKKRFFVIGEIVRGEGKVKLE